MPGWKRLLLNLYYRGSYPIRWWSHRRAAAGGRVPIVIIYYHRVADEEINPWTISNRAFARQITWLQAHFELVSLQEVQQRVRRGENHRRCVSITFDDGYADNCHEAIPLLVKERIPCTYFVTLQNVLKGRPFAHDLALGHALQPNSLEQLKAMAAAGIEIAAHTNTHPDLGQLTDRQQLRQEVVVAGKDLQAAVDRKVRYFAFPFGQQANLSREAFAMAREAGYEAVCSAYGGLNYPGDDPFHLQRIAVSDDLIRLKNRVTVDPRKAHVPRFDYESPPAQPHEVPQETLHVEV